MVVCGDIRAVAILGHDDDKSRRVCRRESRSKASAVDGMMLADAGSGYFEYIGNTH